jgi:hypothetical protein
LQTDRERLWLAVRAAKALCDNINEFGTITDGEIFDLADEAIRRAVGCVSSNPPDSGSVGSKANQTPEQRSEPPPLGGEDD